MATGLDFASKLLTQVGDTYVYGAEVPLNDPNPKAHGRSFDCCLTAETIVHTTRGPVRIDEVEQWDAVWSWDDGNLRCNKVVDVKAQPVQDVYRLRTKNRMIRATANHPFLVMTRGPRGRRADGTWEPVEWHTEWRRLDQISRGDWIVTLDHHPSPDESQTLLDGTLITDDVAWLIGVYVGDGSMIDSGFNIAVFGDQRGIVDAVVERCVGVQGHPHPQHGLMVHSAVWRRNLVDLGFEGARAATKRVPAVVKRLGPSGQRAFLAGYAFADGHFDKRGHQSYHSCNPTLIAEVRAMHIGLGDAVSNMTVARRTKPIIINGVTVKHALPLHSFTWYPTTSHPGNFWIDTYGMRRAVPDTSFSIQKVRSIEPDGTEPTWDLEIEGSHNFAANGIIVHNSEGTQWASYQVGIFLPDGAMNQLAYCKKKKSLLTVAQGLKICGSLLFHGPSSPHVGISLGNGKSVEARNRRDGVGVFTATGRNWTHAGWPPGLVHDGAKYPANVPPPPEIQVARFMIDLSKQTEIGNGPGQRNHGDAVTWCQILLNAKLHYDGRDKQHQSLNTGVYDRRTYEAILWFQASVNAVYRAQGKPPLLAEDGTCRAWEWALLDTPTL